MALLLPSVAMTCKGIRGVANASSSFFAPVFIKGVPADAKIRGRSTGVRARIGGNGDIDLYGETIADDFYSVLGLVLSPRLCCSRDLIFCFVWLLFCLIHRFYTVFQASELKMLPLEDLSNRSTSSL
jgi:hypothetical protein